MSRVSRTYATESENLTIPAMSALGDVGRYASDAAISLWAAFETA